MKKLLTKTEIKFIEGEIEYEFKNDSLLIQAFTRKSYGIENHVPYNDIFKIIGDSIIRTLNVKDAHQSIINELNFTENYCEMKNELFNMGFNTFEQFVNEEFITKYGSDNYFARCIKQKNFENYLLLNKSDINNNVKTHDDVKAELFKAIIGAIAVDSNWDFDALYKTYKAMKIEESLVIGKEHFDYVSLVQKWYYGYSKETIECKYKQENNIHNCTIVLMYEKEKHSFTGVGKSKKEARQNCCKEICNSLNIINTPRKKDQIAIYLSDTSIINPVNRIQELYQHKLIPNPVYEFETVYDNDGNPKWKSYLKLKVTILSTNQIIDKFESTLQNSKKDSKLVVALSFLQLIKELIKIDEDFNITD